MKSYIKKIAAVVSAVSIIGTMSISVSAANCRRRSRSRKISRIP